MNILVLAASKERQWIVRRQGILLGDIPTSMLEGLGNAHRSQNSPEHTQFKVMLFNNSCSKMAHGDISGMENLVSY